MAEDLFWLNDGQWEVVSGCLPRGQRGPKRSCDRTVISGIIHVLRSGCSWRECPPQYGPYTTVFNRFNRWRRRGIWQRIVAELGIDVQIVAGDRAHPAVNGDAMLSFVRVTPPAHSASTKPPRFAGPSPAAKHGTVFRNAGPAVQNVSELRGARLAAISSSARRGARDIVNLTAGALHPYDYASRDSQPAQPALPTDDALLRLVVDTVMRPLKVAPTAVMAGLVTTVSLLEALYDDERSSMGLAVISPELRYLHINAFLAKLDGIPASEHVGRSIHDVVPGRPEAVQRVLSALCSGRSSTGIELCGDVPDEPGIKRFWLEFCYPVKNPGGSIGGLVLLVGEFTAAMSAVDALPKRTRSYGRM